MTFDEWWESQGRPPKEQLQFESLEAYEIANDAWIAATWEARDPVPQFDIPAPWIVECRPLALPAAFQPPPRVVEVAWGRNWSPLSNMAGSVPAADRQRLRDPLVGAVILFSRNFRDRDQVRDLVAEIRSVRSPHLLVAVDQEGAERLDHMAGRRTAVVAFQQDHPG